RSQGVRGTREQCAVAQEVTESRTAKVTRNQDRRAAAEAAEIQWSEVRSHEPTWARIVRSSWKSTGLARWKSKPASLLRLMSSSLSNPVRATPLTGCFRLA